MNDPEVLKRRVERKKALDAAVKDMLGRAPGRVPSWERERLMQMDRFCLQNNKRCIMWDDAASGFYLVSGQGNGWPDLRRGVADMFAGNQPATAVCSNGSLRPVDEPLPRHSHSRPLPQTSLHPHQPLAPCSC